MIRGHAEKSFVHTVMRRLFPLVVFLLVAQPCVSTGAEKVFHYGLLGGAPESLDFAKATSLRSEQVAWLLCDTLVYVSKDGQGLEPGLAESWTVSPDGRRVVMKLRSGVLFHDGTPFDANAAKANIERQFRSDHPLYTKEPRNGKESMLSGLIDQIQATDSRTLTLTLKYPGLHYLSEVDIGSPTALARMGKEFGRGPACSGPFKFESWTSDRITLTANEKYWAGRPRIDRVVFKFILEGNATAAHFLKGELDFAPVLPDPNSLEQLRGSPHVNLLAVPGLNVFYVGMSTEQPPLDNPVLRKAVVQAIDVRRLAQLLGRGTAQAAKGPLSEPMKGYDSEVTQAPYDPQASRDLLRRMGQVPGLTLRLAYNSGVPFMHEQAAAMQADLARVGINMELLGKPTFQGVVTAARAREGNMFMYSWHVRAPYPERILRPLFHSSALGTTNLTHYRNASVDKMLEEAATLPEGPEQLRLYSTIQRTIVNDAPMVFLYHATRMAAHSNRIRGIVLKVDAAPADKLVRVDIVP